MPPTREDMVDSLVTEKYNCYLALLNMDHTPARFAFLSPAIKKPYETMTTEEIRDKYDDWFTPGP